MNNTLNKDLWDGKELKPEVKDKLLEIAQKFEDNLEEDGIKLDIIDEVIVGSNANFNYKDDSDIDLHLVADTSVYEDCEDLAIKVYEAYKRLFNNKYDPTIYGHEVEIYVEPDVLRVNSNGIYSLETGWLKEPKREEIPEIDEKEFNRKLQQITDRYDMAETTEEIVDLLNDIYLMRQKGILKDGEYSLENQVFKEFRSRGLLKSLKDKKTEQENKEMSLESYGLHEALSDLREENPIVDSPKKAESKITDQHDIEKVKFTIDRIFNFEEKLRELLSNKKYKVKIRSVPLKMTWDKRRNAAEIHLEVYEKPTIKGVIKDAKSEIHNIKYPSEEVGIKLGYDWRNFEHSYFYFTVKYNHSDLDDYTFKKYNWGDGDTGGIFNELDNYTDSEVKMNLTDPKQEAVFDRVVQKINSIISVAKEGVVESLGEYEGENMRESFYDADHGKVAGITESLSKEEIERLADEYPIGRFGDVEEEAADIDYELKQLGYNDDDISKIINMSLSKRGKYGDGKRYNIEFTNMDGDTYHKEGVPFKDLRKMYDKLTMEYPSVAIIDPDTHKEVFLDRSGNIHNDLKSKNESLKEAKYGRRHDDYDPEDNWSEDDINLHKSINWGERNYDEYPVEGKTMKATAVCYRWGREPEYKECDFVKIIRPNAIFPPYWAPVKNPFTNCVGPMYDGKDAPDGYGIHNRYEDQKTYDIMSENLKESYWFEQCGLREMSHDDLVDECEYLSYEDQRDSDAEDHYERESLTEEWDETRAQALANHLGTTAKQVAEGDYDNSYEDLESGEEYLVLDQDEAYERAFEEILMLTDDLGLDAFTDSFKEEILNDCMNIDKVNEVIDEEIEYYENEENDPEMLEYLQNMSDEEKVSYIRELFTEPKSLNDFIDLDKVAEKAIDADGVAHFISYYDGEEIDLGNGLYAYRIN